MARHEDSTGGFEGLREDPVRAIVRREGAVVVELAGELDLYNADDVRRALAESVDSDPSRLVIDLSAVEFVDSTILGALVEARAKLGNGRFVLAAPGAEIRRTLEVSGLDRHFAVHETVDDALPKGA